MPSWHVRRTVRSGRPPGARCSRRLLSARAEHGGDTIALVDGDERALTYDEIIRAGFAPGLGAEARHPRGRMRRRDAAHRRGGAVAFFALSAFGRIPTMLNFTSGAAALKSALHTAQVKRVVTARRLVDKAGLGRT